MHHPYAEIPELSRVEPNIGLIRIPDQQDIPFTPRVRALVDTAEFRRLSEISQLALTSRVYPGATHTRFEHALGVFNNALRYLWQLGRDQRFASAVDPHLAEVLIVAALLHDIGHWPFCHPIEDMELDGLRAHESFASELLSSDSELAEVLREEWSIEPGEVLEVLDGENNEQGYKLVRSVLSGPIDIDKMDYLDRDSLHCGVPYGRNFDRSRLIESLLVNRTGDGLAISNKGKTAAELMVFARYVMFSEVYWHHAVRSATTMFARAFFDLHQEFDLRELFLKSESEMISSLQNAAQGTEVEPLVAGVFGRRRSLYKRVAEFSLYQNEPIYQSLRGQPFGRLVEVAGELAQAFSQATKTNIQPTDVIIDAPPAHREVEFRVDIYFPKEDVYRPLQEVSPVVDSLARTQFDDYVKRVRIFVAPHIAPRLSEIQDLSTLIQAAVK
ncbi:MAG: HD domain-containing protein [Planctomycetaceae bacterium]